MSNLVGTDLIALSFLLPRESQNSLKLRIFRCCVSLLSKLALLMIRRLKSISERNEVYEIDELCQ